MSEDVIGKVKSPLLETGVNTSLELYSWSWCISLQNRDEIKKGYNELEAKTKAKIKDLKLTLDKL